MDIAFLKVHTTFRQNWKIYFGQIQIKREEKLKKKTVKGINVMDNK